MSYKALMQWPNGATARRSGTVFIQAALAQGAIIIDDPGNILPPEWKTHEPAQEVPEPDPAPRAQDQGPEPKRGRRRRVHER